MKTDKLLNINNRFILVLIIILALSLFLFFYQTYSKLRYIESNIDGYVNMYAAHVADEFRRFKYDNIWVESLYYFDAYASLCEPEKLCGAGNIYAIANRLKIYTQKEYFDKLDYSDALYIADFLDSMLTVSPPTSDEVLEFLNFIAELNK